MLIGFMGTGKSAVGRELTRQLPARCYDTDREIERRFQKTVPEIFLELGEDAFRNAETELLRRMASATEGASHGESVVVATGGGTPLREENALLLSRIGKIVYLTASPDTILSRVVRHLNQRPLLAGHENDPLSRIDTLLSERGPKYEKLADFQIDTTPITTPAEVALEIIRRLRLNEELCG